MSLTSMGPVLQTAFEQKYAIGAFNMISLEFLEAIVGAAEKQKSPVIINIAEVHFPFIDLELCVEVVKYAANRATIPVALNLDHGLSAESAEKALAMGFTSVMFDGSSLSYDENKKTSYEISKLCHFFKASLEVELGSVGSEGGGRLESSADPSLFTDPGLVADFVKSTNCDALAVAIGNSHGKYKGKPELDFERLAKIRNEAGIPLVLHGGSGISDDDFRKAIDLGIAKINFFTGMSQAALNEMKNFCSGNAGEKYNDFAQFLVNTKTAVGKTVFDQIEIFKNGRF